MMTDVCVCCGCELAKMERNRSVCWECVDRMTETYD
jgi:predicted amidophosphoribosyltransferase